MLTLPYFRHGKTWVVSVGSGEKEGVSLKRKKVIKANFGSMGKRAEV
jgi:hypothetical protein